MRRVEVFRWRMTHSILRIARIVRPRSLWLAHRLTVLSLYIPPPWISPWRSRNAAE